MQAATAVLSPPEAAAPPAEAREWTAARIAGVAAAGLIGFGAGISAFLHGYYDLVVWGWIGIGFLAAAVAFLIGWRAPAGLPFKLALGGLVALWLWSLLTALWAESTDQALMAADRWVAYAAFVLVTVYLVRDRWAALALLGGVFLGGIVTVGHLVLAMGGSDPSGLFNTAKRIDDPIGYQNALGTYLLVGAFWPAIAVAERARPIVVSALAAAVATLAACLLVLTQSRGVAAATVVSIVVVMALVPGRVRRGWLLVVVAVGLAAAAPTLLDVYRAPGPLNAGNVHNAQTVMLIAALSVAAAWCGALLVVRALDDPLKPRRLHSLGTAALIGLGVVCLVGAAVFAGRVGDQIGKQWDAFVRPGSAPNAAAASTRLISGAGNRYDYWRIALDDFTSHPFGGVGAGNYPAGYFLARHTNEDVRQPHSIELQALAELGIVGGIALLVFLAGVYLAAWRRRADARGSPLGRMMLVAALGGFTGWLVHTSVDWMVLMPGMTAMALGGAAVLLAGDGPVRPGVRLPWQAVGVGVALAVLATIFLARGTVAEQLRTDGQSVLSSNPKAALQDAQDALDWNGSSVPTRYLQAAAYARLGNYGAARGALLEALKDEPNDWVTWALLGDIAVRAHSFAQAKGYYVKAQHLNPREIELGILAFNPRGALLFGR
jgi:O-antigen ligase